MEHKAKLELELMKIGKAVEIKRPLSDPNRNYIISDSQSLLDMDYKDILLLGMEKEEASFRIYVDLVAKAYDSESREVLLSLAQEEVMHKQRFLMEYDIIIKQK